MLHSFFNIQLNINSLFLPLETVSNIFFFWIQTTITYINSIVPIDSFLIKQVALLIIVWFNPYNLNTLYNYMICDTNAYIWLWTNGNIWQYMLWSSYNFFFQLEASLYFTISTTFIGYKTLGVVKLNLYFFSFSLKILKFSLFFLLVFNILFYARFNIKLLNWTNNIFISKFFILFETEEELGSIDDGLFFISLFIFIFSWYFLISFFFINSHSISLTYLIGGFIILITFVLLIPLSTLIDFGLAFATYVRGAGSSSNVLVELIFDLIGTFVVFIRFLVQNIRFVLIFGAYFELFEFIYGSPFFSLFNYLFNFNTTTFFFYSTLEFTNILYLMSIIIFGIISYLYYFVHLVILLFIQLGAYFLISFWLFFFFYTSFALTKYERFFFYKKYLN